MTKAPRARLFQQSRRFGAGQLCAKGGEGGVAMAGPAEADSSRVAYWLRGAACRHAS